MGERKNKSSYSGYLGGSLHPSRCNLVLSKANCKHAHVSRMQALSLQDPTTRPAEIYAVCMCTRRF